MLAIDPGLIGVVSAAFLAGVAVSRVFARRASPAATPSVEAIVRDLCALNGRLAADSELAALLVRYNEAPARLDRVERVRARAWFGAARRLHGLLAEALEREPGTAGRAEAFAPSMGEGAGEIGASRDGGFARPRISNVTLIDPEFMAWVEAMQERRRA